MLKRYWFSMVGNWDYMTTYAEIYEAENETEAVEICKRENPNSTIREVVEL